MINRLSQIILLSGAVAACNASSPAGPATDDRPNSGELPGSFVENRGQSVPITEIADYSAIEWGTQDEIVFNTAPSGSQQRVTAIRAIRLSDHAVRNIHVGPNYNYLGYSGVRVSPDGTETFFILRKPIATEFDVFHAVPGGTPDRIAVNPGFGSSIIPTPDSKGAVYGVAPDSIRMFDVATKTSRRVGEGCLSPVVFAPDGRRLLCRGTAGTSHFLMTMSDGTVESASVPPGSIRSMFWNVRGLQAIYENLGQLEIFDVATGGRMTLLPRAQLRQYEFVDGVVSSRDGRRIAVATRRRDPFSTRLVECVLYVIETDTGLLRRSAVIKLVTQAADAEIGSMAFSPDGKSVAYAAGNVESAGVFIVSIE